MAPKDMTIPTGDALPAELLMRRDRTIRYERGSAVYATDSRIGVLRQLVVDPGQATVVALVVELEGDQRRVFLSPDLVDKTGGSAVFLTVNRMRFAEGAATAPTYDKRRFGRVDVKALRNKIKRGMGGRTHRAIAEVGKDFVETPAVALVGRPDGGPRP